jgi:hypothetical protein
MPSHANFALLAMPGHQALALTPAQVRSPIGTSAASGHAIWRPISFFENIFLPPSAQRLTSNSRAAQFDKLKKRGKASRMC